VYRVEGGRIVRYTTKEGLCNDSIRQIEEDDAGNLFFRHMPRDQQVRSPALSPPVSRSRAASGSSSRAICGSRGARTTHGPYRYDGKSLYRLEFPREQLEDEYRAEFPAVPYSPYGI
jgi:hypothetical protein